MPRPQVASVIRFSKLLAALLIVVSMLPSQVPGGGSPATHQEDNPMSQSNPVFLASGTDGGGAASRPAVTQVLVRVRNASSSDFRDVRVFFPDAPDRAMHYGAVASGGASEYLPVSRAYRYAHIEVTAGGKPYSLRPIDYVGEEELGPGRYTDVLRTEADRLTVALERD